MVKTIPDKAGWDEEVAAAKAAGKKIVVDFTASWCGPCKMIGPYFVELADSGDYPNLVFVKIDVDENEEVAALLGIQAMPTFKVMDGSGNQTDELVGASKDKLKDLCGKAN